MGAWPSTSCRIWCNAPSWPDVSLYGSASFAASSMLVSVSGSAAISPACLGALQNGTHQNEPKCLTAASLKNHVSLCMMKIDIDTIKENRDMYCRR